VGNGDIRTPEAVAEAFARYGVDGVMIGRAALGKPWLFRQAAAALAGEPVERDPTLAEQRDLLLDHYRRIVDRFGPQRGTVLMRRYACCYGHGSRGAREFRGHVAVAATQEEFLAVVNRYFPTGPTNAAPASDGGG
jgi:tRNA-dihydrouridine synthase B